VAGRPGRGVSVPGMDETIISARAGGDRAPWPLHPHGPADARGADPHPAGAEDGPARSRRRSSGAAW